MRRTRKHQRGMVLSGPGIAQFVQATHNLSIKVGNCRAGWHWIIFVVQRDVIKHIGRHFAVHLVQSAAHNCGNFVGKSRVVGATWRHGAGQDERVTILMLQTFAHQRGAPGGGGKQKPTRAGIRGLPNQIAHSLKTEH